MSARQGPPPPLDNTTRAALLAAGVLFCLAGAGWAYWGSEIFLTTVLAGLAYCF